MADVTLWLHARAQAFTEAAAVIQMHAAVSTAAMQLVLARIADELARRAADCYRRLDTTIGDAGHSVHARRLAAVPPTRHLHEVKP